MGGLDYGELEEGELDAPAASTPVTPATSQYLGAGRLAGWAGGGSVPPPARPAGGSGYGAATPRYASHLGAGGPHTTGKDGRDGSKRMRTGRNGWVDTSAGSNAHKPCVFFIQGHCKNGSKCTYLHGNSPLLCTMFNTTTGKDGRDGSKRMRTGRNGWVDTSAGSNAHKPCVFFIQGHCKNGSKCTYLHGNSPLLCTMFNTRAGCKFGDKCAFRHDLPGARDNGASNGVVDPADNPFSVHASNCGCLGCHPPPPRKVTYVEGGDGDEDEDGEVLEIVEEPEEPPEFVGERAKDPAEVAERDEVLRRCSVIEAPAAAASWREFLADAERNAGSGNGLAPFWKVQQATAGARGAAT